MEEHNKFENIYFDIKIYFNLFFKKRINENIIIPNKEIIMKILDNFIEEIIQNKNFWKSNKNYKKFLKNINIYLKESIKLKDYNIMDLIFDKTIINIDFFKNKQFDYNYIIEYYYYWVLFNIKFNKDLKKSSILKEIFEFSYKSIKKIKTIDKNICICLKIILLYVSIKKKKINDIKIIIEIIDSLEKEEYNVEKYNYKLYKKFINILLLLKNILLNYFIIFRSIQNIKLIYIKIKKDFRINKGFFNEIILNYFGILNNQLLTIKNLFFIKINNLKNKFIKPSEFFLFFNFLETPDEKKISKNFNKNLVHFEIEQKKIKKFINIKNDNLLAIFNYNKVEEKNKENIINELFDFLNSYETKSKFKENNLKLFKSKRGSIHPKNSIFINRFIEKNDVNKIRLNKYINKEKKSFSKNFKVSINKNKKLLSSNKESKKSKKTETFIFVKSKRPISNYKNKLNNKLTVRNYNKVPNFWQDFNTTRLTNRPNSVSPDFIKNRIKTKTNFDIFKKIIKKPKEQENKKSITKIQNLSNKNSNKNIEIKPVDDNINKANSIEIEKNINFVEMFENGQKLYDEISNIEIESKFKKKLKSFVKFYIKHLKKNLNIEIKIIFINYKSALISFRKQMIKKDEINIASINSINENITRKDKQISFSKKNISKSFINIDFSYEINLNFENISYNKKFFTQKFEIEINLLKKSIYDILLISSNYNYFIFCYELEKYKNIDIDKKLLNKYFYLLDWDSFNYKKNQNLINGVIYFCFKELYFCFYNIFNRFNIIDGNIINLRNNYIKYKKYQIQLKKHIKKKLNFKKYNYYKNYNYLNKETKQTKLVSNFNQNEVILNNINFDILFWNWGLGIYIIEIYDKYLYVFLNYNNINSLSIKISIYRNFKYNIINEISYENINKEVYQIFNLQKVIDIIKFSKIKKFITNYIINNNFIEKRKPITNINKFKIINKNYWTDNNLLDKIKKENLSLLKSLFRKKSYFYFSFDFNNLTYNLKVYRFNNGLMLKFHNKITKYSQESLLTNDIIIMKFINIIYFISKKRINNRILALFINKNKKINNSILQININTSSIFYKRLLNEEQIKINLITKEKHIFIIEYFTKKEYNFVKYIENYDKCSIKIILYSSDNSVLEFKNNFIYIEVLKFKSKNKILKLILNDNDLNLLFPHNNKLVFDDKFKFIKLCWRIMDNFFVERKYTYNHLLFNGKKNYNNELNNYYKINNFNISNINLNYNLDKKFNCFWKNVPKESKILMQIISKLSNNYVIITIEDHLILNKISLIIYFCITKRKFQIIWYKTDLDKIILNKNSLIEKLKYFIKNLKILNKRENIYLLCFESLEFSLKELIYKEVIFIETDKNTYLFELFFENYNYKKNPFQQIDIIELIYSEYCYFSIKLTKIKGKYEIINDKFKLNKILLFYFEYLKDVNKTYIRYSELYKIGNYIKELLLINSKKYNFKKIKLNNKNLSLFRNIIFKENLDKLQLETININNKYKKENILWYKEIFSLKIIINFILYYNQHSKKFKIIIYNNDKFTNTVYYVELRKFKNYFFYADIYLKNKNYQELGKIFLNCYKNNIILRYFNTIKDKNYPENN